MPDSNLSTSIAAVKTKITTDAPTATVDEILSLARAAKSVGLSEDAAVESAINSRVLTLSSGATTANMVKLANVIKQVRDATSSSGLTDISQLTDTTNLLSSGGGSSVTVSDTAPTSPSAGDMWFNSLDLKLYIRYNDGVTSQWIIAAPAGPAGADSTVAGPAGGDGRAGVYADMAALIAKTGMVAGDTALVTALNKVFMYTGSAWFLIATMTNDSPTAITGVDAAYNLATDGTATIITAVSTDPEGFALTWSYAVTTGSLGSTATVSQADNVFTITPSSTEADAGEFSITFSVTDGATGAVQTVSAFTLSWYTFVKPTVYTSAGNGINHGASIASQSATSITFNMNTYSTSYTGGRHLHAGLELPYGKYYFEAVTTNNINHDMFALTKYDWATQPTSINGGSSTNYGWIYNTDPTAYQFSQTNDIGTTASSGGAYNALWSLSSHANAESRMGIAYDSVTNNWWMRLGRSAWMWGDPVAGTGGYNGSTAGVSNGTSHKFFLGTASSTGNYSFRVESQPLHQYSTPTGFTPL